MATFYNHSILESDCLFSELDFQQLQKNKVTMNAKFIRPFLLDEDGENEEVSGFCGDLYCPHCQDTFDFILIEFENSSAHASPAYRVIDLEDLDEDILKCPKCGYRDLEPV